MIANKGYIIYVHAVDDATHTIEKPIMDYKFFCFNGLAKCMKVDFDRFVEHHANYYDMKRNQLEFGEVVCPPVYDRIIEIPESFNLMKELAEKLADGMPFLRADFYDVNGQVYFGELTFYPASGFGKFTNEDWDNKIGRWMKLPGGGS